MDEEWTPTWLRFRDESGAWSDTRNVGIYDGVYLVWVDDDLALSRAHPGMMEKSVYAFPPGLPIPAQIGSYDTAKLHRPYSMWCRCYPQTYACVPVFDSDGFLIEGHTLAHDPSGHRWWRTDAVDAPLYNYKHYLLPGRTDAPCPAIPGTIKARRHELLRQQGKSFWTYKGIYIPKGGHFAFERRGADAQLENKAFRELVSIGGGNPASPGIFDAAIFAALVTFTRPTFFGLTGVLETIDGVELGPTIGELAARIALRQGAPEPADDDDETLVPEEPSWPWFSDLDAAWNFGRASEAFTAWTSEWNEDSEEAGPNTASEISALMAQLLRENPTRLETGES